MGPFSFGMLLTLGPWGRVCPFILLNGLEWDIFWCPMGRPVSLGEEVPGSPWSLDLHGPDTLVERIFESAFS